MTSFKRPYRSIVDGEVEVEVHTSLDVIMDATSVRASICPFQTSNPLEGEHSCLRLIAFGSSTNH
jgi:hypothetical protein